MIAGEVGGMNRWFSLARLVIELRCKKWFSKQCVSWSVSGRGGIVAECRKRSGRMKAGWISKDVRI